MKRHALLALAVLLGVGLAGHGGDRHTAEARKGMVVSVSPPATAIGVEVLRKGGNAVDAAVAVAFAMAVTWPEAGNIGGGGFMLVHPPNAKEAVVIDFREKAPGAATRNMFAGKEEPSSYLLVGVPGTVRGLARAHQRFGKLPWKDLVLPAVKLAEKGFPVDEALARSLNSVVNKFKDFAELQRVFGKGKGKEMSPWKVGDRLVQEDLARTLRLIADKGADAFYQGKIADLLVAEMKKGGGLITHKDLRAYQARVRRPIHGRFRGYDIYGPPPPSSGGICLVEMLHTLENFDLKKQGRWSAQTLHYLIEAMRRAYCDRARYLGDPDFVSIPPHLTSKTYAKKLAESIAPRKATPSEELAPDIPLAGDGDSTTHFAVIDEAGMGVSCTYTLEHSYGGKIVVRGAGFLLNNEMGDFNPRPGITTRQGLIGTPANEVRPGKRMLSSQTPTIVARDGKVVLLTGSPGGRTIINTVLQVVLNVLEWNKPLREAVDAPRLHHGWFPDEVRVERALARNHGKVLDQLRKWGHRVVITSGKQGDAHSIWVDHDRKLYLGVADQRRDGAAAGY
jgi:gamma-glutamyltranspeptidase/glutathione hydrolase